MQGPQATPAGGQEQAGGSAPSSPPPEGEAVYRFGLVRPAERVFCGCVSITQGMQSVSVYLMAKGVVAMLSVLTSTEADQPKNLSGLSF